MLQDKLGLSDNYLKKARNYFKNSVPPALRGRSILPATGKSWRWARINGQFYYDYDSIPDRAPTYYRSAIKLEELLQEQQQFQPVSEQIKSYIIYNYNEVATQYPKHTPKDVITSACAFLFAAENLPERRIKYFLQEVIKSGYRYLPKTWHSLYKKVRAYQAGVPVAELIHRPREGNANALAYSDAEVESWLIKLRADGRNYTNAHIIRKVRHLCRLYDKPVPSTKWMETFLANYEVKYLTTGRYGSGRLANRWNSYVPVDAPMYAGDAWMIDATRLNIIEHRKADGSKGFLFMITVMDVYSGDILGYNFDYKEDRWAVLSALKMAVAEAGYLPYEMIFDKFPGHNTPEAEQFFDELRHLGVKVTFTPKATGKARLERFYSTLQTVFMQDSDYYYGEGIQSRRYYAHRSPEYLQKLRQRANKEGFNLQDAVNEGIRILETYRQTAYAEYSRKYKHIKQSPAQLHAESDKPNVRQVKEQTFYNLLALKKELKISRNGLIQTQIMKQDLVYQVEDYDIIRRYEKVWIAYMPENLDKVHLFVRKNHLWMWLGEASVVEPVQVYGPNAEFNKLAKIKQRIRKLNEQREAQLNEILERASRVSEVALMMGPFTDKGEKETAESEYLQAAGDDIRPAPVPEKQNHRPGGDDFDITGNVINQL